MPFRVSKAHYPDVVLCGGYDANCVIAPLDGAVPSGHEYLDEADSLGYDSDSDIEDDDDDADPTPWTVKMTATKPSFEGVSTEEKLGKASGMVYQLFCLRSLTYI